MGVIWLHPHYKLILPSCKRKWLSSDQRIFLHDAKSICGVPDTKRAVLCASVRRGRLIGLLTRYPAVSSRFRTILVEMALLEIQLSLRIVQSSRGDVLRGCPGWFLSLASFLYKSTNYSMILTQLTPNSPAWQYCIFHSNICHLVAMDIFLANH